MRSAPALVDRTWDVRQRGRLLGCLGCTALLAAAFIEPLFSLVAYSATADLNSHILLVPLISAYLIHLRRKQLPKELSLIHI